MFPLWEIFFRFYRHFFQNAPSHHSSWSSSPSQVPEGCLSSLPQPSQPNPPNLQLHLTARCQGLLQFSFLLGMQRRKASCLKRLQLEGRQLVQPMFSDGCLEILNPRWKTVPTKMVCYRKLWWTLIPLILTLHQWKKLVSCWRSHKSWDKPCLLALPHTPHAQQKKTSWSSPQPSKWFYKIWCWIAKPGYSKKPFQHLISSGRIFGISSSLMWSHHGRKIDNPIPKLFVKLPYSWDRVPWFSCLLQRQSLFTASTPVIESVKKEASKYLTWHTRVVKFDLKDIPKILDQDTQLRCVVRDLAGGP